MSKMTVTVEEAPALYCGTYGKYNNGSIYGKWLKLEDYTDAEEFLQACQKLHSDEADAEFMYQDYEYLPRALYSEALSLTDLERIYDWLEYSEDERQFIAEYLDEVDEKADFGDIEARYWGRLDVDRYKNEDEAYGYYCAEIGLIDIPEHLEAYFDYESYGREQLFDVHITDSGHMFTNI